MTKGNLPLLSPPPEDIHLWVGVNQAALPLQSTKKPGHAALESVAHLGMAEGLDTEPGSVLYAALLHKMMLPFAQFLGELQRTCS